jgi:hypothetical protein
MSVSIEVSRLLNAGLLVEYNEFGPYKNGWSIGKPAAIQGNTRKNYESYFYSGDDEVLCDAPSATIFPRDFCWIFQIWECVPQMGFGDFELQFESIDLAVNAVLEYYFGNPTKMNPPELLELLEID